MKRRSACAREREMSAVGGGREGGEFHSDSESKLVVKDGGKGGRL